MRRQGQLRGRWHPRVRHDLATAGALWVGVAVTALWSDAISPWASLVIVAATSLAAVVVVSARHVAHLTGRLRAAEAREVALVHEAGHDSLTGVSNRALLFERLQLELRRLGRSGGSVLVAYLDVNDLKVVNDSFGHAAGDCMLQTAADRLTSAVRDVDTLARIGGDEFVVVCAVDDQEAAERLIERLSLAAARPLEPGHAAGLSLGWVLAGGPDDDPAALVAQADVAMYRAKRARQGQRGSIQLPLQHRSGRAACGCPAGWGFHLIVCPLAGRHAGRRPPR